MTKVRGSISQLKVRGSIICGDVVNWTNYFLTRTPSNLIAVVISDTQMTATWANNGVADYDDIRIEIKQDGGAYTETTLVLGTTTNVFSGLTAATLYYVRIRYRKGINYSAYITVNVTTMGISFAVLDTLADGKYNILTALAQNPINKNKIIETYCQGVSPNYDDTKILKMRVSNDKGRTFGAASTIYDPGGILCVQEQHSGYTSDGRFHILCTLLDNAAVCSLIYLYSDNDGTSFTIVDISALVVDATYVTYRNSGALIENNGVLLSAFYSRNATPNSWRKLCLRLVAGTWTKVTVETTATNETESSLQALNGDNLIMMSREDVTNFFVQYSSADNGLTWTRLGITDLGLVVHQFALPGQLSSFQMNGEKVIVMYFSENAAPKWSIYSVYARASDLLVNGLLGWERTTIKKYIEVSGFYTRIYHGIGLHYDNNYNSIGCWPLIMNDYSSAAITIFDANTTDWATIQGALFGRVEDYITAIGLTDAAQLAAIRAFDQGLVTNNLRCKTVVYYPFIGDTADKHKWNLKNPLDTDAAFRLTFANDHAANHTVNGYAPNGTDQYADTHIAPLTNLILYSAGLGYYSRTNVSETSVDMGAQHVLGTTNPCLMLRVRYTDGKGRLYSYNGWSAGDAALTAVVADSRGLTFGSRTAYNVNKIYINGAQSGATNTNTALDSTTDFTIYIGANNADGTAASFSTKETAGNIITLGFTDAQALILYNLIQALQTALGRNV